MLNADVRLRRGEFELRIALTARPENPLVIVGESGAGKTTFLEMLAGTIRPDTGRIAFDEAVWFDSERKGVSLPTYQRPIGYVAQTPTLFPHMNVRDNVAFGLRASGVDARTALGRADGALREVGLEDLDTRKPAELSGGQRQRVTLARALCLEPKLLLLDEPLSSLDVGARQAMRAEIRSALKKLHCVAVYVTHDPLEALSFGDEIAVIENGIVSQVGSKVSLLREPRSHYVGRFVGINLFRGSVRAGGNKNVTAVKVRDAVLEVVDVEGAGEVFVAISPQDITLSKEAPSGSARNVFQGRVEEIVPSLPLGERMRVQLKTNPPLVAEITKHAAESMALQPGTQVYAAVKATAIRTYR